MHFTALQDVFQQLALPLIAAVVALQIPTVVHSMRRQRVLRRAVVARRRR